MIETETIQELDGLGERDRVTAPEHDNIRQYFTEIGRVPWIVFGVMKIEDAVSPGVTAAEVLFSLVGFTILYGVLMVADLYLLDKYAKAGLPGPGAAPPAAEPARA